SDRGSGVEQLADRGYAGAESSVGRRTVRRTGAGASHAVRGLRRDVHGVRHPHVVAEPAEPLGILGRTTTELGVTLFVFVQGFGEVGVQADTVVTGQFRSLTHQLFTDRERGAGPDGHSDPRLGGRVVVP